MDVKAVLRSNLLRLWNYEFRKATDRQPPPGVLEALIDKSLSSAEGLLFSDTSPQSHQLRTVFPTGPPYFKQYRDFRDRPPASDRSAAAEVDFIGESPAIRKTLEDALRIAASQVPVLIQGETGTGKELLARLIHQMSPFAEQPLVTVNCGAIPETLLTAELFGFESGSFTGAARKGQQGRIEAADGGTLFLDEIANLSPAGQAALLRFLDTGEIQKIGRIRNRRVDVRLICAVNRELVELVESGVFREDLFYRIALVPIRIPPLRERKGDIDLLTDYFLRRMQTKYARCEPDRLTPQARLKLSAHHWPGNVRELIFVLERAFLICEGKAITVSHLPDFDQPESEQPLSDAESRLAARLKDARQALFRDRAKWARFLIRNGDEGLVNRDVVKAFQLSEAAARIRLSALVQLGILKATGSNKGRRYWLLPPFST